MEHQIKIKDCTLTREEYIQTAFESVRRLIPAAFAATAVLTFIIAMLIEEFSARSIIPPFVIVALLIGGYRILIVNSWKQMPKDTRFSYEIDKNGWTLSIGEESAEIPWRSTHRLTVRSHVVLLYNDTNRSNTIPRRYLTVEDIQFLKQCMNDSRKAFKGEQKIQDEEYRQEFRKKRQDRKNNRRHRRLW